MNSRDLEEGELVSEDEMDESSPPDDLGLLLNTLKEEISDENIDEMPSASPAYRYRPSSSPICLPAVPDDDSLVIDEFGPNEDGVFLVTF